MRELVLDDLLKPRGDAHVLGGARATAPPESDCGAVRRCELQLVDTDGRVVGTVDAARAFHVAHPGAIYLHQGRQYRVTDLDTEHHVAVLEAADDADEHTQPRETTDIAVVATEQSTPVGRGHAHLGAVRVEHDLVAYQRRRTSTNEVFEVVPLDFPPRELTTRACWYTVPLDLLTDAGVEPGQVIGAVHAAEHAADRVAPLVRDLRSVGRRRGVDGAPSADRRPDDLRVRRLPRWRRHRRTCLRRRARPVHAAHELVSECSCDDGCPSCVQSPKCGNWNEYLDKQAAVTVLEVLGAAASPEAHAAQP